MTTYESEIKTISSSEEVVFDILGNLNNLSKVADNKAVGDKIKDLQYNELIKDKNSEEIEDIYYNKYCVLKEKISKFLFPVKI